MYPCLQVRDVRIISDRNSRRSKGIAYIEFVESSSVPLAIGLTGQRLLGVPIIVQASQVTTIAAKSRSDPETLMPHLHCCLLHPWWCRRRKTELPPLLTIYRRAAPVRCVCMWGRCTSTLPKKCFEESLSHLARSGSGYIFNVFLIYSSRGFIRSIFALKIEGIQLMMDSETGRSKGYGFISVNRISVQVLLLWRGSPSNFSHFFSLQMQNVQKKLWSSWMALSWRDVQWRLAMWRSAQTRPQPAPSWITTSWRGQALTWEPPGACSSWPDWQKVCSSLCP